MVRFERRVLVNCTVLTLSIVSVSFSADPVFVECTSEAGIAVQHEPGLGLVAGPLQLPADMIAGAAIGDFDGDGWQDIFVLTGGSGPDYLFLNDRDGTFTDRAAEWGVDDIHMGVGASVGDYNADGWLDVYVTSFGPGLQPLPGRHRLYRNDSGRGFSDVAAQAGVERTSPNVPDGFGSTFGDFDLDGDLDLFVVSWGSGSLGNRLFRNEGDGTFTDVTLAAGIAGGFVHGFSPRFVDMNGDRFPELLIAADFGTSQYYQNDGDGTFTLSTSGSGTGMDDNGMGHTVADFDGNGLLDWYVTSIRTDFPVTSVPGTGNMLYLNQGDHLYVESSIPSGVNDGGWGWGTAAIDFDHDGYTDIVETNGWIELNANGMAEWQNEQSYAFRNLGGGVFSEIGAQIGIAQHRLMGRGLMNFDFDNDGDQDILITSFWDELRLYRNDLEGSDANWFRVFFDTAFEGELPPHGFGTQVVATVGGKSQRKHLDAGCNYLSQSELSVHFGVGTARSIDILRVEWADGAVSEWHDVPANQTLTLSPPRAFIRGDCDGDGQFQGLSDAIFLLAAAFLPGAPGSPCFAACDADGDGAFVGVADAVFLLNHQFLNGSAPSAPYPGCGLDPVPLGLLGCSTPSCP